jgi:hypothetical protein
MDGWMDGYSSGGAAAAAVAIAGISTVMVRTNLPTEKLV